MTITLTIDNVDALPDGGPISHQAHRHGFELGREQHLDWTLPDPARYISGRHCEIRYEGGAYWLYDVSSNGTFLNGAPNRVKSPYRLAHGDRLSIGHYIIRVEIEGEEAAAAPCPPQAAAPSMPPSPQAPGEPVPAPPAGDIWDTGTPAPPPADRRDFMPEAKRRQAADFSDQFLAFPQVRQPEPPETPPPPTPGASESPFGPGPGAFGESSLGARPTPPAPQPPADMRRQPAATGGLLDALARGAGVPSEAFAGRNPEEVAFEIGEVLRASVENLTQLLKARAAAKTMTKSANRTMIGAADNNPLKFVPAAEEAIEIMFRRNRSGYMGARQSIDEAFDDLKRHELATYAAMQKALARLLDEFAPDTIEAKSSGSSFPLRKGRNWDLFVSRWEAKSSGDNGMLDVFLAYFAEAYDEANRK